MAGQYVVYVSTVLGSVRNGVLATANATQVGSTVVYAEYCTTIGDGGGGMFRWDAAGGTDDGGTIIVPGGSGIGSSGPCWRRLYSGAINVRWFGAQGDTVTDDTFALQQAMNFLMNTASGGKLYIPAGVYKITYTLMLIGYYSHNYVIEGDIGGENYNTEIIWAGPPGCTMLDCWGINVSFFRHLTFNGGGHNLNAGGATVSSLGAGCCTWFHTNQYNTQYNPNKYPRIGSKAASFFVCFEDVTWAGVVGGLYAACAVGDGPRSPGDLTVDSDGNFTAYLVTGATPPVIGENVVEIFTTTLTQDSPISQTKGVGSVFNVTSTGSLGPNRYLIAKKDGVSDWVGRIVSVNANVITAIDQNQLGLPFDMPKGSAVYIDMVCSTTLTQDSPKSQVRGVRSVFNVVSTAGFIANRALIACQPGHNPWVGRIVSVDDKANVITAIDQNQLGLPFDMPAGSTVYNMFPDAVAVPLPASAAIVNMPSEIGTSECQGYIWEKCNFLGGGWDTTVPYWIANTVYVAGQVVRANPDNGLFFACASPGTSAGAQPAWNSAVGAPTHDGGTVVWTTQLTGAAQHCYTCVAVYSGYNTEQFGWRDCNVFNQGGVLGIYSPANANNEWFAENVQFVNFSGAAVSLGPNNFAKLTMYQCATESPIGFGYFVKDGGSNHGCLNMDGCEVVYNAVGNPYTSAVVSGGPTRIERCVFSNQYYDLGRGAQPLSVSTGGNIIIEDCAFVAEQYQIPVFLSGNEVFASYFEGAQHPGTNRTHQWGGVAASGQAINEFPYITARLHGNSGSDENGEPLALPDLDYQPTTLFAVGPFSNTFTPSATETYRAQPRTTTSCYEVDWTQIKGGGGIYLCSLQDKSVVRGAIVECTAPFAAAATFSLGTQIGGYKDLFASAPIPAANGVLASGLTNYELSNTWIMNGNRSVALTLDQAPTSGHLKVYLTTEVVQVG